MEFGQAIILGNITLPVTDDRRIRFNGAPISCALDDDFSSVLLVQDVSGLVDLRFAPDDLLAALLRDYSTRNVTRAVLTETREFAKSGRFLSAEDVLLASGFSPEEAEWIAGFSTIHGRDHRLAREVTPQGLLSLVARSGQDDAATFGASPSNATFRIEVFTKTRSGRDGYSISLYNFDHANGLAFTRLFEKRWRRRSQVDRELTTYLPLARGIGLRCEQVPAK